MCHMELLIRQGPINTKDMKIISGFVKRLWGVLKTIRQFSVSSSTPPELKPLEGFKISHTPCMTFDPLVDQFMLMYGP